MPMPTSPKYPMPRHVRLRIADAAQVEVRTLERYLLGLATRDRGAARMEAALIADGWGGARRGTRVEIEDAALAACVQDCD